MNRRYLAVAVLVLLAAFLTWRFVRPMNIFVVTEAFERPTDTRSVPPELGDLHAATCGRCHADQYAEWRTTIHSQAWTEPYFQVDWRFDRAQQVCRNCHTPLDRQQPQRVLGFRDRDKLDPVLAPNPDFDPELQHEGVTCTACHLSEGAIAGVLGTTAAPHPVRQLDDPNEICVRCHVVEGSRWDTFFHFPPCGTVAEIQSTPQAPPAGFSGEVVVPDTESLRCVECHMPLVRRPLVEGGPERPARRHLWRGGHDPQMVRGAIEARLAPDPKAPERAALLRITNVGAAHYLPTGTPDRHLSVTFRALDEAGRVLDEDRQLLQRKLMWRPFIIDLWDTRLPRWQTREYRFEAPAGTSRIQVVVRYHLLTEERRQLIGYENETPIAYEVFSDTLALGGTGKGGQT